MNRSFCLLLLTIAQGDLITACSDEAQNKLELEKIRRYKAMPVEEMTGHEGGGMPHAMPMPAESASATTAVRMTYRQR